MAHRMRWRLRQPVMVLSAVSLASLAGLAWAPRVGTPGAPVQVAAPVPKRVYHVPASLPADAKVRGVTGPALVALLVGRDGTVRTATIVSGPDLVTSAAVGAARQWRFEPASAMQVLIATVTFRAHDPEPVSLLPLQRVAVKAPNVPDQPDTSVIPLEADVGPDGVVLSVRPLGSDVSLAGPAVAAVRQWRFARLPEALRLTFAVNVGDGSGLPPAQVCSACDAVCRSTTDQACTPGSCRDGSCLCWRFERLRKQ